MVVYICALHCTAHSSLWPFQQQRRNQERKYRQPEPNRGERYVSVVVVAVFESVLFQPFFWSRNFFFWFFSWFFCRFISCFCWNYFLVYDDLPLTLCVFLWSWPWRCTFHILRICSYPSYVPGEESESRAKTNLLTVVCVCVYKWAPCAQHTDLIEN